MNKKLIYGVVFVVVLLLAGFFGIKIYGSKKAQEKFENLANKTFLGEFYSLEVESFDFNPFTREYIFKNMRITSKIPNIKEKFEIKELRVKLEKLKDGFILSLKMEDIVSKFDTTIRKTEKSHIVMKQEGKTLQIKNYIYIKDLFKIKYELEFENFDKQIFPLFVKFYRQLYKNSDFLHLLENEEFALLISKFLAIIPKKIEIEYEELGFFEKKILEKLAEKAKENKETVKKELLSKIKSLEKESDENSKKILQAIAQFLDGKKGKLEIEIENIASLSIQDFIVIYTLTQDIDTFLKKIAEKIKIKVEFEK
jgi:ribosomal protein L18E